MSESTETALRQTPLVERHRRLGARLVPFAGWLMPVQYASILEEHRAVRAAAGLFDLTHMGEVEVTGSGALSFLQEVASNDISRLEPGAAIYALLTNPQGGVIDDIIVYRYPDRDAYLIVVNAANRDKDVDWLQTRRALQPERDVTVEDISDRTGMVAIQGPQAVAIAARLTDADLSAIAPFHWARAIVAGVPALVARTGYTGEDGFEFFTPIERIADVWDALLGEGQSEGLVPVGLGARDTLRLEARMPLYGNELSDTIGPLEAGLGWAVALDKGDFIGRAAIAAMKEQGAPRRLVGFKLVGRSGSPRHGYPVMAEGRPVGEVTSGAFSPTLGENIGLALIERGAAGVGKPLDIIVRGKAAPAVQVKLPFYRREHPAGAGNQSA
ncbi:MAG: glycine cleavage system aminomethyltransferase GcvT [Thermomicrobiales bacterium]|nr:glycine cleavage system aminomethyltransferase GcvT [Thermomicrobiales bacterium]